MAGTLDEVRYELAVANRIIAREGVLDAFGHVSARHPTDPSRYLLPHSRSPELIEPGDIYEFTLDSEPISSAQVTHYAERVIHGCIYRARSDVNAVCHHHSLSMLPFCITGAELLPVFHLGAVLGGTVPLWDSRDEFGDTNMLVIKPEEGRSLARALGPHAIVLMRRHGATVVGSTLRELVFRTVYSHVNAELQLRSTLLGKIAPMSRGEVELAGPYQLQPRPIGRAWEYWTARLERSGQLPNARAASGRRSSQRARPRARDKPVRRIAAGR